MSVCGRAIATMCLAVTRSGGSHHCSRRARGREDDVMSTTGDGGWAEGGRRRESGRRVGGGGGAWAKRRKCAEGETESRGGAFDRYDFRMRGVNRKTGGESFGSLYLMPKKILDHRVTR